MAAPAGRILAAPLAARRCRIQYRFDALADPTGGFGLCGPDRLQNPHHKPGVDLLDGQGANEGVGIGGKGVAPLVAVLCVPPAGLVRLDESLGRVLEGYLLGRLRPLRGPLAVTGADGVNTSRLEPTRFQRPAYGLLRGLQR